VRKGRPGRSMCMRSGHAWPGSRLLRFPSPVAKTISRRNRPGCYRQPVALNFGRKTPGRLLRPIISIGAPSTDPQSACAAMETLLVTERRAPVTSGQVIDVPSHAAYPRGTVDGMATPGAQRFTSIP
jgi:hypothetical protein